MLEAIRLSELSIENPEFGPFGAVIVRGRDIVGTGHNRVLANHDPSAHAEIIAIRDACSNLESHELVGCSIYTSCEPCPMCLGAIYWARIECIFYGNIRSDAAAIGFSDDSIYAEFARPIGERTIPELQFEHARALEVFERWVKEPGRILY